MHNWKFWTFLTFDPLLKPPQPAHELYIFCLSKIEHCAVISSQKSSLLKRSLEQCNILHLCVILLGGGWFPSMHYRSQADTHPPRQTPLRADTPLGRHHPLEADIFPDRHHLPSGIATEVDSMHPTGMHSCL